MPNELSPKNASIVAIITGGTQGLGLAIVAFGVCVSAAKHLLGCKRNLVV
jgi:NAD(P)-dependent dehydrogenase (short-subunit alcohol dehydrogenase family)